MDLRAAFLWRLLRRQSGENVRGTGAAALGLGKFADGAGLWLVKTDAGRGKRVLRVTVHDRRREMGLGAFPAVPLSEARTHAEAARAKVRAGLDPIKERQRERRGLDACPHGFRSSLRDWLAETTDAPHEVAETVLGHVTGGAVVNACRRTDYLEQRRELLERWASHVAGGVTK